jgi:hypothetical protein
MNMDFKYIVMIKKYFFTAAQLSMIALVALLTGCKKDETESFVLSRQFAPSTVTGTNGETQVTIVWPASLFTVPASGVSYQLDVSKTNTFDVIDFTTTTTDLSVVLTDAKLTLRQDYFARVKALAANGSNESNFVVSSSFRITGEQLLLPVPDGDVIDNKVIIRWKPNAPLSKLTVIPSAGNGSPFDVALTSADLAAQQKLLSGLVASKTYSVEGYGADGKYRGTTVFTTKAAIAGNIVDLRGIPASRKSVLTDTLGVIPAGSVVLLKKGNVYELTAGFTLTKTVTMQAGLDFGSTPPMISMVGSATATSVSFGIGGALNIDSIVFKDITIKGNRTIGGESYNFDYIINSSGAGTTVKLIRYVNCTIKRLRGTTRAQAGGAGTKITNLYVSNCFIDSVREYGIATASGGSAFANIRVTNTTMARFRKFIDHRVAGNVTTTLENITLNEVLAGTATSATASALLDFNGFAAGAVTLKNCIFGKTWDETGNGTGTIAYGIRATNLSSISLNVTGTYKTNDFIQTVTTPATDITGLLSYAGSSTALFTDPPKFNFKIKDQNFAGKNSAGDPRWR